MKFKSKNTAPIFYLYCQKKIKKKITAPISSIDVHDLVLDFASWIAAVIAIKYKLIAINKGLSSSPTNNRPEIPSMQHFKVWPLYSPLSEGYVLMGMFNNVGVCFGVFFFFLGGRFFFVEYTKTRNSSFITCTKSPKGPTKLLHLLSFYQTLLHHFSPALI